VRLIFGIGSTQTERQEFEYLLPIKGGSIQTHSYTVRRLQRACGFWGVASPATLPHPKNPLHFDRSPKINSFEKLIIFAFV
jgi:hypothetical protein